MNKKLLEIQIALFFKDRFFTSIENVSLKMEDVFGKSEDKKYANLPDNAPGDIPILLLTYSNFKLNFSRMRVDIFTEKEFKDVEEDVKKIIKLFLDELNIEINRVGFVKTFFSSEDVIFLKSLLNNKAEILNFKEVAIRLNILKNINEVECNNIQNILNGAVKKTDGESRTLEGIIITRDVNTVDRKVIDESRANEFIRKFDKESEELIYE